MNKLAYIKYSQKEANQKIWNSLVDIYELLKKKNIILAYLSFPFICLVFSFVFVFSWISFFTLLFKDIRFTPHYLKTSIETSNMTQKEIIKYLDSQFSDYKTKVSYKNISLAKQKSIEATFDILYSQYRLPEPNEKYEEIISNITTLQQSIEDKNQKSQTISDDLSEIKQHTSFISQYTEKKLTEEKELEKRKIEKINKETSKYNREKGRNLDSFESALTDEQIAILVNYCNEIPVFNIDITNEEMKAILLCTHVRPLQTTVNKYIALLFEELCKLGLICKTWKRVAMKQKCFISPNGKELTSKDLSSANLASGLIKPKVNDLIEKCIEKIKEA